MNMRGFSSPFLQNRNVNESLSCSFTLTWRNAFSMSPRSKFGDMRAVTITSLRNDCNEGPVNMQSFMLLANGWGLALASKTMRTFVVTALYLTTGLCGMQNIRSPGGF